MRFKALITTTFCVLLSFIIAFSSSGSSIMVNAAKSVSQLESELSNSKSKKRLAENEEKRLNAKIESLKSDKSKQEELKRQLDLKITNNEEQIALCNDQIRLIDSMIAEKQADIMAKENELYNTKELFKKRLRAMYMSGGNSGLLILLGSDDFSDFLSKSELTKSVSEYDNALMEEITNKIKEINSVKTEIEAKLEEQNKIKKSLAEKQRELNKQKAESDKIITTINTQTYQLGVEKQKFEEAIDQYESDISYALKQIQQERAKQNQGSGSGQPKYDGSQFLWPVSGYYYITSPFGRRLHPIYGTYSMHNGIDISGGGISGKPILATADGTVMIAKYNGSYGNYVMLNHGSNGGNSYATLYAHMTSYAVSAGQSVKKGDIIGYVGSTGDSTGAHLHYEIRVNGTPNNPLNFYNNVK